MAAAWQIGDYLPYEGHDRWQVRKILRGGMGIVYIVYDYGLREPFAAKTFRDDVFAYNPSIADRFRQEALAWTKLDAHHNVTRARFVENIGHKPYLFLEYVSGGDLSKWINTPYLIRDLPQVLRFAIQFCDGMTHAKSKGIRAHRDIKPQNCLITEDKILKVSDFGLAKVPDDIQIDDSEAVAKRSSSIHLTKGILGTCAYMAPEQFDDARRVSVQADIYSFGVMLFQMITGKLPFNGPTCKYLEQLHKTQSPPETKAENSELEAIVQKCLAKDSVCRYSEFVVLREILAETYESLTGEPAPQPVTGAALDAVQWIAKGVSLGNLGQPKEEALDCYEHALALNQTSETAWYNKGGVMLDAGRLEEALACYDRALELNRRYVEARGNKGVVLGLLGQMKEALACFELAVELYPLGDRAWVNKGNALDSLGRPREALHCFNLALSINSSNSEAWFNKARVLATKFSDYSEALLCFKQAQQLGDKDAAQALKILSKLAS